MSVAKSGEGRSIIGRFSFPAHAASALGVRPRVLRGFGALGVSLGVRSKLRTVWLRQPAESPAGVAARLDAVPGRMPAAEGGRGCQLSTSVIAPSSEGGLGGLRTHDVERLAVALAARRGRAGGRGWLGR